MRQEFIFSPDLFIFYSDAILRELGTLSGFIIGECYRKNIRYAGGTVDSRFGKKTIGPPGQGGRRKWEKKEEITTKSKKTENMVISQKEIKMLVTDYWSQHQACTEV